MGRLSCCDADLNISKYMKTIRLDRERQIDKDRGRNIYEIETNRKSLWRERERIFMK